MPEYTYTDDAGHYLAVQKGQADNPVIVCGCGKEMWRMPCTVAGISWGGLSPSNAMSRSTEVSEFINPNNIAKRRDAFERKQDGRQKI